MKKKILWSLAAVVLVSATLMMVFASGGAKRVVKPVDASEQEAIEKLSSIGLIQGYEDGELHPEYTLTRAEAVTLILRANGFDDAKWFSSETELYRDVEKAHWASGYIYYGTKKEVLVGMGDRIFAPESEVTYAQFAKMLVCLLGEGGESVSYPDGYLSKADELGITQGLSCAADEIISRGQASLMLYYAMEVKIGDQDTLMAAYEVSNGKFRKDPSAEKGYLTADSAGAGGAMEYAAAESAATGTTAAPKGRMMEEDGAAWVEDTMPDEPWYGDDEQENIKAGTLTAGEIDDLKDFFAWQTLMEDEQLSRYQSMWRMAARAYTPVTVTDGESPVVGAHVTLYSADTVVAEAVTNVEGLAYLFSDEQDGVQQGQQQQRRSGPYRLTVETQADTVTVEDISLTDPIDVTVAGAPTEDILDLMFMIDTTGSMGDELRYIQEELKDVVLRVNSHVRISCNYYRDHGDEYVVCSYPFTTNVDKVVAQISEQYAAGGGDYEEAVDEALQDAVFAHDWSPSARERLLFLVLDAPPHNDRSILENVKEAVSAASAQGIRIIPIASSGIDKETEMLLRTLAIRTGGTYLFLTDDSGIGYSHLKPSAEQYETDFLNEKILKVICHYLGEEYTPLEVPETDGQKRGQND